MSHVTCRPCEHVRLENLVEWIGDVGVIRKLKLSRCFVRKEGTGFLPDTPCTVTLALPRTPAYIKRAIRAAFTKGGHSNVTAAKFSQTRAESLP